MTKSEKELLRRVGITLKYVWANIEDWDYEKDLVETAIDDFDAWLKKTYTKRRK